MKNILLSTLFTVICLGSKIARADETKTYKEKGYTLNFVVQDLNFSKPLQEELVNVFFKVYPKLAKTFNKHAVKEVTIIIDTAYSGVAYAHNGKVTISQAWLTKRPGDIDVVTHEVMHLVQAYPSGSNPGWLVEGVADYVRFKYGVDNAKGGWSLPMVLPTNSYSNSYRITARFLDWIETQKRKGIVKVLDKAMRNKNYTPEIWVQQTGLSLDELWSEYQKA